MSNLSLTSQILTTATEQRLVMEIIDGREYRIRAIEPPCGLEYFLATDSFLWEVQPWETQNPAKNLFAWIKGAKAHKSWTWKQRRGFKTMVKQMRLHDLSNNRHVINSVNVELATLGIQNIRVLPLGDSEYEFFLLVELGQPNQQTARANGILSASTDDENEEGDEDDEVCLATFMGSYGKVKRSEPETHRKVQTNEPHKISTDQSHN